MAQKIQKAKVKATAEKRQSIAGAGPKIMVPAIVGFAATAGISYVFRPMFDIPAVPREWVLTLGLVLLVPGILLWAWSLIVFLPAYRRDQLATKGPYALALNPIYSSWIVLVFPGIALVTGWWLILLTSVLMYAAMRMVIREEDDYLAKRFGKQYTEYRKRVMFNML